MQPYSWSFVFRRFWVEHLSSHLKKPEQKVRTFWRWKVSTHCQFQRHIGNKFGEEKRREWILGKSHIRDHLRKTKQKVWTIFDKEMCVTLVFVCSIVVLFFFFLNLIALFLPSSLITPPINAQLTASLQNLVICSLPTKSVLGSEFSLRCLAMKTSSHNSWSKTSVREDQRTYWD